MLQLTADESIFLSPFQRSERSLPGSAKVWLSLDLYNEQIRAPIDIYSSKMKESRNMENIMLCQAEYDLAVTVGSQGSAAACKER